MIEFNNVSKSFATKKVLNKLKFNISLGEMVFLTGKSGAGKSTLLKLIAKCDSPTSGDIIVNGTNLDTLKNNDLLSFRRNLGLVFQDPMLINTKTVFNNVALPLVIAGCNYREITKKVSAALGKVSLLTHADNMPNVLSTGEQQRVSIARAIVAKPGIILADEPTGNLDSQLSAEIIELFRQFNMTGTTVVIASHDLALVNNLPYKKLQLAQGNITTI